MKKLVSFLSTFGLMLVALPACAQSGGDASDPKGMIALAAGLAIGIAALGGAIGQGNNGMPIVGRPHICPNTV